MEKVIVSNVEIFRRKPSMRTYKNASLCYPLALLTLLNKLP